MERAIKIERSKDGRTKVIFNGMDYSPYITSFSLTQSAGDSFPKLTIIIPATTIEIPDDFFGDVEVKKYVR